jgi:hypothetical protein
MIHAACHSADNMRTMTFDATPWFEQADADSIIHIVHQNWSSQAVADALSTRPGYEELRELIQYARERLRRESYEDALWPTFECCVDATEALAWLDAKRPEVAARVRAARAGGGLVDRPLTQ